MGTLINSGRHLGQEISEVDGLGHQNLQALILSGLVVYLSES